MRIVHFSDIHFCLWPENFGRALFDKRILGLINFFLRRRSQVGHFSLDSALRRIEELKPQVVVCTGDVASISSEREFEKAVQTLSPLLANPDFEFVYIPGNHDHYVKDEHCQRAFREAFRKLNCDRWTLEELPATLMVENNELMVCDECRPTNIFLSSGYIEPGLEQALRSWLESPRRSGGHRILAGHYPTRDSKGQPLSGRRCLNGGEIIRQALRKGQLDAYICGHIHEPYTHQEECGSLEVCAGALTTNGKLNVLDLSSNGEEPIKQFWQEVGQKVPD